MLNSTRSSTHSWHSETHQGITCYQQSFEGDSSHLKSALEACATKAVSLLEQSIQEDSLYLLFEWNPQTAELAIVVTDARKQQDSAYVVKAQFPAVQQTLAAATDSERNEKINALNDSVKFLLSDFLASYSPFFSYSLVAIFHSSTRAETSLL